MSNVQYETISDKAEKSESVSYPKQSFLAQIDDVIALEHALRVTVDVRPAAFL